MRHSRAVPLAIVLGGLLIAWAVFSSMGGHWSFSLFGARARQGNPALVRPVSAEDHILGNPTASAMIVEYCDFESEYCKGFSDTLHQIVATEGVDGRVAWVYRAFPLVELHENALTHAQAAECVAKVAGNDAFWEFADALYAKQPVEPSEYGALASAAGVADNDAFATCYADAARAVDERIKADRQNALDIGATGAPYSLLLTKGRAPTVLDGAYTYDALREVIDKVFAN